MAVLDRMIAVMQAHRDGKLIEVTIKSTGKWNPCANPAWNWACCDYRVKKEPREFIVSVDECGKLIGVGYAGAESVWVLSGRASAGPGEFIKVREILE